MRVFSRKIFFFKAILALGIGASSQKKENFYQLDGNQTTLDADEVYFEEKTFTGSAKGNAVFRSSNLHLFADEIHFEKKRGYLSAKGKVVLITHEHRILAHEVELNLNTGDFKAKQVKTGYYPIALTGKSLEGSEQKYQINQANIFLPHSDNFESNFLATRFEVNLHEKNFKAEGVSLRIGNKTFLKLPFIKGNLDSKELNQKLRFGRISQLGWYGSMERTWKSSSEVIFEVDGTLYSKRGFFLSPKIFFENTSYKSEDFTSAYLEFGGIIDQGKTKGYDESMNLIPKERGYAYLNSINRYSSRWRFATSLFTESDGEIFRDFQTSRYAENQWYDDFGELNYEGSNFSVSALLKRQINGHDEMVTQDPSLRFDWDSNEKNLGIHQSLQVEYCKMKTKGNYGRTLSESSKFDTGYKVQRPVLLPFGITYLPSLSFRSQWYDLGLGEDAMREFGEWGNGLSMEFMGEYGFRNEIWDIRGLRHLSVISLKHRRNKLLSHENEGRIPTIDSAFADLNLPPLDLLDYMEADSLSSYEVMRIEWINHVMTNLKTKRNDLFRVSLFHDLWINENLNDSLKPNTFGEFLIKPADWLNFSGQTKLHLKEEKSDRSSFSLNLKDGMMNEFKLSYFQYLSNSKLWQATLSSKLDLRKSLILALRYDEKNNHIPFWLTEFSWKTNHNWLFSISLSKWSGTNKEDQLKLGFKANLFSF